MQFKSRFARSLPLLALSATLLFPFKPVSATSHNVAPGADAATSGSRGRAAWVVPAPKTFIGDPASVSDESTDLKRRKRPRHKAIA